MEGNGGIMFNMQFSHLGVSTVPYTATAVLHTVSIRPSAVPYLSRIHKFESPHRHGTVIATAVYGSRRLYG